MPKVETERKGRSFIVTINRPEVRNAVDQASREIINTKLREILDDATDKWGTKVTRVELQRIEPPADVTEAMHRQMKAERNRRSMILEAEGHKQSAILKAEGDAEAVRRVAEAEKFRKLTVAAGEAEAISTVYSAIHEGRPTNDLIAIKYLEALEKIADGKATKVFLPIETSGVLGSIAGIGELLKERIAGPPGGGQTYAPSSEEGSG